MQPQNPFSAGQGSREHKKLLYFIENKKKDFEPAYPCYVTIHPFLNFYIRLGGYQTQLNVELPLKEPAPYGVLVSESTLTVWRLFKIKWLKIHSTCSPT